MFCRTISIICLIQKCAFQDILFTMNKFHIFTLEVFMKFVGSRTITIFVLQSNKIVKMLVILQKLCKNLTLCKPLYVVNILMSNINNAEN